MEELSDNAKKILGAMKNDYLLEYAGEITEKAGIKREEFSPAVAELINRNLVRQKEDDIEHEWSYRLK